MNNELLNAHYEYMNWKELLHDDFPLQFNLSPQKWKTHLVEWLHEHKDWLCKKWSVIKWEWILVCPGGGEFLAMIIPDDAFLHRYGDLLTREDWRTIIKKCKIDNYFFARNFRYLQHREIMDNLRPSLKMSDKFLKQLFIHNYWDQETWHVMLYCFPRETISFIERERKNLTAGDWDNICKNTNCILLVPDFLRELPEKCLQKMREHMSRELSLLDKELKSKSCPVRAVNCAENSYLTEPPYATRGLKKREY